MIIDFLQRAAIAVLGAGFIFSVVMFGFEMRAEGIIDRQTMRCVADIGPAPDVKDYCEALVKTGREWKR